MDADTKYALRGIEDAIKSVPGFEPGEMTVDLTTDGLEEAVGDFKNLFTDKEGCSLVERQTLALEAIARGVDRLAKALEPDIMLEETKPSPRKTSRR